MHDTPHQKPLGASSMKGIALAVLTVTLSAPALGQFGDQAGFTEVFKPDFYRRDMQLYSDYLQLEEWQRPIIEILLDDYQVSFDLGTKECRDEMSQLKDELQADPDNAMMIAMRPIRQWEIDKRELKRLLVADIQGQLSPLQLQRWPSLERAMRREKELPLGSIPGESMNVFVAINELDLDPNDRQEVEPILLKYEIEVDSALVRRREALDKYQDVLKDAMISKDTDTGLDALRKICDKRGEICRLHIGTINDLNATLPEEAAGQFRASILRNGFPMIYSETRVDKLISAVRAMDDLTDDQIGQLDALESAYDASLLSANEMLLETYLIHGKELPIIEAKRAIRRRNREPINMEKLPGEIIGLQQAKDEMLADYRRRILAILSQGQQNALPPSVGNRTSSGSLRGRDVNSKPVSAPTMPGGKEKSRGGKSVKNPTGLSTPGSSRSPGKTRPGNPPTL